MEKMNLPVIYIKAGERPVLRELPFERPEGELYFEPAYQPLREMLGCDMVEHVSLAPGVGIWCDEEGRLVDAPKLVCNVDSPFYEGDMVGESVVVVLEHQDAGMFAPLFSGVLPTELRDSLSRQVLYTMAQRMVFPPLPGQVPAEPHVEVTGFDLKRDE